MIGKTLGSFKITSQLRKDGVGEVYQAKDQKLGPYEVVEPVGACGMGEIGRCFL
jgi:hypothetical protein